VRLRRVSRVLVKVVVALLLLASGVLIGHRYTAAAQTANDADPFYLVVGGSSSLGMQPTGVPSRSGRLTSDGYADDLAGFVSRDKGVNFEVVHVGCPGETAQSMLEVNNGGQCNDKGTPQLTKAIDFLKANQNRAGLVSIDIGFNDVRPCRTATTVDEACMSRGITLVSNDLPSIVQQLTSAAGPNVVFVGLEYYDPFLADYMVGSTGPTVATTTLEEMNELNTSLDGVYTSAGVAVANVPSGFQMNVTTRVDIPNVGQVPENVAEACLLTWMCQSAPFGPDDHPDNAGYMVIAESIAAVLPAQWRDDPTASSEPGENP
jgi:lysophospholipase L1-like esterase